MTHTRTKIIGAVSIIIFLVCVSTTVIAFVMVLNQKGEYREALKKRAESEALIISQKSLAESLLKTKNERALLASQILKDADVIELLSLIETLGKEQGTTLETNSLTVEKIDQKFETLVVNLQVIGPYPAVMQMLALLEYLPYQSVVSTVQLERMEEGKEGRWKGVFALKVTKYKKNEN